MDEWNMDERIDACVPDFEAMEACSIRRKAKRRQHGGEMDAYIDADERRYHHDDDA